MGVRTYNYMMGFLVNNSPIPDPSVFTGANSALDTSAGRSATGLLHRAMVARKHPLKLEYHYIDWEMMEEIMKKMQAESFSFTYRDPMEGVITITAYAGDFEWTTEQAPNGDNYMGNLNFSVIEY